jgi:hypothetical protein
MQSLPASIHTRQASADSGLGLQLNSGGYSYFENPSEMDLNFGNISLDPATLMDVDPSSIPPGPLVSTALFLTRLKLVSTSREYRLHFDFHPDEKHHLIIS